MSINLKDTTYLLNNGFIMVTKKGTAWRCGKGYRKDWSKLIGKEVLLHGSSYTLTQRVKKNSKWYLVFTDGTNNYTELQTKALHNKGMAKDTIIEVAKRVIAGLLTAPKSILEQLIEQVDVIVKKDNEHKKQQAQQEYNNIINNSANYTKKGTLRKRVLDNWEHHKQGMYQPHLTYNELNNLCKEAYGNRSIYSSIQYRPAILYSIVQRRLNPYTELGKLKIALFYIHFSTCREHNEIYNKMLRKLKRTYHPDNKVTGDTQVFNIISSIPFALFG